MKAFYTLILVLMTGAAYGQSNLPACQGSDATRWSNCFGSWTASNGNKYVGEYKDGKRNGQKFNGGSIYQDRYPNMKSNFGLFGFEPASRATIRS